MQARTFNLEVPGLLVLFIGMMAVSVVAIIMLGAVQFKCVEKTGHLCPVEQMAPPAAAGQVNAGAPR